jgi:hypothetical protein
MGGDCRNRTPERVALAIRDGAAAVTSVHNFFGRVRGDQVREDWNGRPERVSVTRMASRHWRLPHCDAAGAFSPGSSRRAHLAALHPYAAAPIAWRSWGTRSLSLTGWALAYALARANCQINIYGDAKHSFTGEGEADGRTPDAGLHSQTEARAWQTTVEFLREVFR